MAALTCPKSWDSWGPATVIVATATTEANARRTTYSTRACPDLCRGMIRAYPATVTTL